MRFAIFDIEATQLKSDQGFLLCGGFKDIATGKKTILGMRTVGVGKGRGRDHRLALAIRDHLESYDGIITWNGLMYDIPFLNDRLMFTGEDIAEKRFHIDIMYQARMGRSAMTSSRLDWVAKAMGCPFVKTPLILNQWLDAADEARSHWREGHRNFDYIIDHNNHDLDVTEWVYNRLKNRVQTISKR